MISPFVVNFMELLIRLIIIYLILLGSDFMIVGILLSPTSLSSRPFELTDGANICEIVYKSWRKSNS